jgi:hypothetical protein
MKRYYLLGLFVFLFPVILVAADAKKDHALTDFMRVSKPEGKKLPVSYDTAIVKFADEKNDVRVDLIGAIHIGDKEYYAELNEIFTRYDAVLYELIADANVTPTGRNESGNFLSSIQSGMGSALALDFQLAHVDYRAKNMVHADMSPAEFASRMSERGDSSQMLFRAMTLSSRGNSADAQNEDGRMLGRMLGSFLVSNPALSLKRILAEEMINQMEDATWVIGGDGSAIITDRNAVALKVLSRELQNGKKKIAIFYGAAHLPEFVKSLEKDFNLTRTGIDWIVAWDLTKDKSARK